MVGTLTVQNLQGPASGANANKVIIPSGHTLDASAGFVPSAGQIVQVKEWWSNAGTNITVADTWVALDCSYISITPKQAGSKFLYDFSTQAEMDHANGSFSSMLKLYRQVNGGGWSPVSNNITYAPIGDNVYATQQSVTVKYTDAPSYTVGQTVEYRLYYAQITVASSTYFNQQLQGGIFAGTSQGTGGTLMEIAQ